MLVETQRQYCHYFLKWNPTCLYWDFQAASSFKSSSKSQEKIKEIQKIKSPSASWWRNCDFLHCHHQCHLFSTPGLGDTLSSPPHPHLPPWTQLERSCSQATCSRQNTVAHPVPCWDILPQPMPQIFLISQVISGMPSLPETNQSSGITGWKHKPPPLQLWHLSRPHCAPPNSRTAIPLHSYSKINKLCLVLLQSSPSENNKYHGLCSYCDCLHYFWTSSLYNFI